MIRRKPASERLAAVGALTGVIHNNKYNVYGRPEYAEVTAQLKRELERLRVKAGDTE